MLRLRSNRGGLFWGNLRAEKAENRRNQTNKCDSGPRQMMIHIIFAFTGGSADDAAPECFGSAASVVAYFGGLRTQLG